MDGLLFGISLMEWVYIIIYLLMMPFFIWGIYRLILLIDSFLKVRKGFLRIWKLLPNDQTVKFWSRPLGGKITIRTRNPTGVTDNSTIPIKLIKGWVWREGMVPFIKLDKDNNQIPWEQNVIGEGIPKEVVDEMSDTSFVAGTLVAFKTGKEMKRLMMIMIIVAIIAGAGVFLNYYFWSNMHIVTQTVNVVATNATTMPIV